MNSQISIVSYKKLDERCYIKIISMSSLISVVSYKMSAKKSIYSLSIASTVLTAVVIASLYTSLAAGCLILIVKDSACTIFL